MVNINYLYNPNAAKKYFEKNYFIDKKLGFSVIENGTILPHKSVIIPGKYHFGLGGIVDSAGNFINDSSVHYGTGGVYTPPPANIQHTSDVVIYLGMGFPVWGHDLTDNIRRVWFLKSDFFNNDFKNCPIVYIPYKDGQCTIENQPSLKRLLEILEVKIDDLQAITQPTQFDKIILPDGAFLSPYNHVKGFTAEYRETIDRVRDFALKNRTAISNKKIYYFNGRKGVGEERIAEYFKSKGYEVVRPEKLTLDEQLNLLINCEHFASAGGSCAQNSLFLRDGTETVFIPRAASPFNYYQEIVNQIHPLNVNYVDSTLSIFSRGIAHGAQCYIVSKQLKQFFGDKIEGYKDDDFKIFLKYVKNSTNKGLVVNSSINEYYSSVLQDFMEQLKRREDLMTAFNMPPGWETFRPLLTYQTHVDKDGWSDGWKNENQISNPLDQKRDIQAIKINFPNHKVYYSVYYNESEGWSKEVEAPETAGTVGKRKSIFGLRIQLDEAGSKDFDVLYRVHKFDDRWTDWAKNGEVLYSYGIKLNAIQIKLESRSKVSET